MVRDHCSEAREVGEFDRIDLSSGIPVELTVDPEGTTRVISTYDDNLHEKIRIEVVERNLVIEVNGCFAVTGSGRHVKIEIASLSPLLISGGTKF